MQTSCRRLRQKLRRQALFLVHQHLCLRRIFLFDRVSDELGTRNIFDFEFRHRTLDTLTMRQVDPTRQSRAIEIVESALEQGRVGLGGLAIWSLQLDSPQLTTRTVTRALLTEGRRRVLDSQDVDWQKIWSSHINARDASVVLEFFERELGAQEANRYYDPDLAYAYDLGVRISSGQLLTPQAPADESKSIVEKATGLVQRTVTLYPDAADHAPTANGAPDPQPAADYGH